MSIKAETLHQAEAELEFLRKTQVEKNEIRKKQFYKKFSKNVSKIYLISQKDVGKEENLMLKPFYLMPFLIK